jgi:hypothetical protein
MRFFLAAILVSTCSLGACDVPNMPNLPVKSQVPSHQAEFLVPVTQYPQLLEAFDGIGTQFGLKRFGWGFKESVGLYAVYRVDIKGSPAALDLVDHKGPGKITLALYGDYFTDAAERRKFITAVNRIVERYGGKLAPNELADSKPKS